VAAIPTMGRFVAATGQSLLATHGHFSWPPVGSFRCPLTFEHALGGAAVIMLDAGVEDRDLFPRQGFQLRA